MRAFSLSLLAGIFILAGACSTNEKTRRLQQHISQGKLLYQNLCENCHGENGTSDLNLDPPLAGSDYFLGTPLAAACYIKNGLSGPITVNSKPYDMPMPAFPSLNENEIADLLCYIGNSWGNSIGMVEPESVKTALTKCDPKDK